MADETTPQATPAERAETRSRLSQRIDEAVEGHCTDELLARLIKQSLNLRYFDSSHDRLMGLVNEAVDKKVRVIIANWIDEHDDPMWTAVENRLKEIHVADLAAAITDEFMTDLRKGTR